MKAVAIKGENVFWVYWFGKNEEGFKKAIKENLNPDCFALLKNAKVIFLTKKKGVKNEYKG